MSGRRDISCRPGIKKEIPSSNYCRIGGFYASGYEEFYLLGYNTMWLCLIQASRWFLAWLILDPEDGGDIFFRKVYLVSKDYTVLYPKFGIL
jgi:hypothetical protein